MQRDALVLAAGRHMFGPVHVESLVAREGSLKRWMNPDLDLSKLKAGVPFWGNLMVLELNFSLE